ncbi:hypothetical protein QYF36_020561 [Acer negundo]|nr:hypothetical protein QYF36_020561 [Acer negundo]
MALLVDKATFKCCEYKVELADLGRRQIELAEVELSAHMAYRAELVTSQPYKGVKITVSLHMTTHTAVLIETFTALGANVRWCPGCVFSTQDHVAAAIARDSAAVFAWKGQTLLEYWLCMERALDWDPDDDGCPDLILDDGGDLSLLIHEGKKAEEIYEENGKLPDPSSTDNAEFKVVLSIIRDGLKSDPKRYHKLKEKLVPISEETTTAVKRREDAQTLKALLSTNLEILDIGADNLPENPLILACKRRQLSVLEEIGRSKPEFYGQEDLKEGCTTFLRLACVKGDVEMVRTLVGLDSQLCLLEDKFSKIPLQTAVLHGGLVVIRELVFACPDSLEKMTFLNETVFHLAAKNYQPDAFQVLLEETKKLNKQHLLEEEDHQGNTVLHIAVSNQLIRIVELLLRGPSSMSYTTGFASWVNAKNKQGHTAMDLYYQIPDLNLAVQGIGRILHEARRFESLLLEQPQQIFPNRMRGSSSRLWLMETKNFLLVVLALFIGLAFTVTCGLPAFFPRENYIASQVVYPFEDVISGELPLVFYIMGFISIVLTISSSILAALIYYLPCGNLLLLSGVSTFNLYVILAYYIMPKFFVRVSSHDVSSYRMMWILALSFIFCGGLVLALGKCLLMHSYNFAIWLKMKL